MNAIDFTTARDNLVATMDRVCQDHAPVVITRESQPAVVLLPLEDYEALEETSYLLRSPVNVGRLMESVHQLQSGQGHPQTIDLGA
jgi:antitoxin YefM